MVEHQLKITPAYFRMQVEGKKRFEIRKDDRGFCLGDFLCLREFDEGVYTGSYVVVQITCMTSYEQKEGYLVLGTSEVVTGVVF